MTKADEFKAQRKADYADAHEVLDIVLAVDPGAHCIARDGRAVVVFSDLSEYTLGNNA